MQLVARRLEVGDLGLGVGERVHLGGQIVGQLVAFARDLAEFAGEPADGVPGVGGIGLGGGEALVAVVDQGVQLCALVDQRDDVGVGLVEVRGLRGEQGVEPLVLAGEGGGQFFDLEFGETPEQVLRVRDALLGAVEQVLEFLAALVGGRVHRRLRKRCPAVNLGKRAACQRDKQRERNNNWFQHDLAPPRGQLDVLSKQPALRCARAIWRARVHPHARWTRSTSGFSGRPVDAGQALPHEKARGL